MASAADKLSAAVAVRRSTKVGGRGGAQKLSAARSAHGFSPEILNVHVIISHLTMTIRLW